MIELTLFLLRILKYIVIKFAQREFYIMYKLNKDCKPAPISEEHENEVKDEYQIIDFLCSIWCYKR